MQVRPAKLVLGIYSALSRVLRYIILLFFPLALHAQYNVDRIIMSGRAALYYEDYVLSIQYFNQALSLKPFLWEPWQLRGVAKFSLEDYQGAIEDVSKAIALNPYIPQNYDLRAVSKIRIKDFDGAIEDYTSAIKHEPGHREFWYNRALCRMEKQEYDKAMFDADTIIMKWKRYMPAYLLKADLSLRQKDTLTAASWIDKALEIDSYNPDAWRVRGYIHLSRSEWAEADDAFCKVLHLRPKMADVYLNRAVARLKLSNLRGAMSDYDTALEIDPQNFLGHYNRGLLRQQVGDDNRAIEDFDFVLSLEPNDMMALFNRATLLDRTGNLKAAIRDYSRVIDEFPNFWTGLHYRAGCYRRLGMTAKAERDEFRILKAQMDKRLGKQQRWTRQQLSEIRKKSDVDPEKYNQIVVADEHESTQEYKSEYRGKVQNQKVEVIYQPYIIVSPLPYANSVAKSKPFSRELDAVRQHLKYPDLYVSTLSQNLPSAQLRDAFIKIDSLTVLIDMCRDPNEAQYLLLARSAAYTITQNYQDAMLDAEKCIAVDSLNVLAWWQHAVCNARLSEFEQQYDVKNLEMRIVAVISDFSKVESLAPDNAYILYCRGTYHAIRGEYTEALTYLSRAITLDPYMPEAYYNRGIVNLHSGNKAQGITDLSKSGELGIHTAYSVIKSSK